MGSASAWKLRQAGLDVVVLEKSVPGAEASSAAAGILGAHSEADGPGPMADFLLAGLRRHPVWATELLRQTDMDIEFRRSGVLHLAFGKRESKDVVEQTAWMQKHGRRVRRIDGRGARRLEPELADTDGGVLFPDDARVDPKLLFRAVHIAAQNAGVRFESGAYVRKVLVARNRVRGVAVEGGIEYRARYVVVAAGSWSSLVVGSALEDGAVVPARGQMIELVTPAPLLERVVNGRGT
jgi:glycine oxidase